MKRQQGQRIPRPRPMQTAIQAIVAQAGLKNAFEQALEQGSEFHLRVVNAPYIPLVIEVTIEKHVSVVHYVEQNGDLVCDPEMTFEPSTGWRAVSFTQGLIGYYDRVPDGYRSRSMESFADMWGKNLEDQGFTGNEVRYESLTHAQSLIQPAPSLF